MTLTPKSHGFQNMKKMIAKIALLSMFFMAPQVAILTQAAEPHVALIEAKLDGIKASIITDITISTIMASNASSTAKTQAEIDAMEIQWKAELASENYVLIASVVSNALADHLRAVVQNSGGLISEINVMNSLGFSVGQSSPNSDIYQGEESKYLKTYPMGPDAYFVDEVEFDDSTQSLQSQVNFTIVDPATGEAIGAVSVGIAVDSLL